MAIAGIKNRELNSAINETSRRENFESTSSLMGVLNCYAVSFAAADSGSFNNSVAGQQVGRHFPETGINFAFYSFLLGVGVCE